MANGVGAYSFTRQGGHVSGKPFDIAHDYFVDAKACERLAEAVAEDALVGARPFRSGISSATVRVHSGQRRTLSRLP